MRHARGGIVAQFDPRSLSLPSGVSMAAQDAAGVTLRADSGHGMVVVSGGNRVRALDGLPTVVAHPVRLARGQWYYEVHVLRAGEACIGWTDKAFFGDWATHCGVGDDKHSWGFQGSRTGGKAKTGGRAQSAGGCWAQGSVVGVAIDVDARTMSFSLDGSTDDTWGVMFTGMEFDTHLVPAISVSKHFEGQVAFDAAHFKYSPPRGYKAVAASVASTRPPSVQRSFSLATQRLPPTVEEL